MSNPVLDAIRSRRVARNLTERPVERALLELVLDAARWAPNAGNRRLQRFVAVQDPLTLRLLRMVSPGMFQRPTAAVLICVDTSVCPYAIKSFCAFAIRSVLRLR